MRLMSAVAARLQPPSEQRVFVEIVVERAYPGHRGDPEFVALPRQILGTLGARRMRGR